MAALESTQFVHFAFPPSNATFHDRNTLWSSEPSYAIRALKASGNQKTYRPAATLSPPRYQAEAHGNTAARADGGQRALANNDDKSDDDSPSLEELSRAALRPKISTEASMTWSTFQRLEPPALHWAGLQVNSTQSESGERQGGSRD